MLACTRGFVKSGVLTDASPLPCGPWHIEQFCLKITAPSNCFPANAERDAACVRVESEVPAGGSISRIVRGTKSTSYLLPSCCPISVDVDRGRRFVVGIEAELAHPHPGPTPEPAP